MPEELTNTATADGEGQQTVTEQVGNGDTAQVTQAEQQPEKTFTQAQLDEIIKDRLGKEQQRFERERTSAAQQARDVYIAEQGYFWKGKPITTETEYKQALEEQEIENMIQSRGYDPSEISKVVASHPDVKKAREFMSSFEQKQANEKMYQEFLDAYPDIKGEDIPPEVWKEVKQGRSLLDAYVRHENKTLREQLQGIQTKEQAAAANQANAQTSTGSVKGQGVPDTGFISKDVFEANKGNQSWMMKNYDQIKKSMGKWGK